jgi:hypothetical protein
MPSFSVRATLGGMEIDRATPQRRVLIIGFDPNTVPGADAAMLREGLDYGLARFAGSELVADECLVPLDDSAEQRIVGSLTAEEYACVVVGGGIRKPEPLLEFFEAVVNRIRLHAPRAAIAFNTDGASSLEAARRALAIEADVY